MQKPETNNYQNDSIKFPFFTSIKYIQRLKKILRFREKGRLISSYKYASELL